MSSTQARQSFAILPLVQALTAVCLCIVGGALLTTVLTAPAGGYQMAEWFVNYAAGFIRRGLMGEIVFAISAGTGMDGLAAAKVAGTVALFAFLAIFVRRVVRLPGLNQNEKFALLFMPTGLSFILLNGNALLRKDYVVFLVFFGFLALVERPGPPRVMAVLLYMASAGTFAVLIHEIFLLLFLPYCGLILAGRAAREGFRPMQALAQAALLLSLPALAAVVMLTTPAAPGAAAAICERAQDSVPQLGCSPPPKPIAYMEAGGSAALKESYTELIRTRVLGLPVIASWLVVYLIFTRIHYEILWRMIRARLAPGGEADARLAALLLCGLNTLLAGGMSIVGFDLGRWFFLLASLATITAGSPRCAPDIVGLVRSLGLDRRFTRLPEMGAGPYQVCVVAAGLIPLVFRIRHCCVYRPLDFFWSLRDILIHYNVIPPEVEPVLAKLACCLGQT